MNKREKVLNLLNPSQTPAAIPAALFIHFPPEYHRGQAAIDKHLEYFRATDMDIVKIQYEFPFPKIPEIQTPADWSKMPLYGKAFFQDQLDVVAGLVKAAKAEALVIQTLYSPFMSAGHTTSGEIITEHLKNDPEKAKKGLEIITESTLWFVRECIKLGVDGFYASTQGGEGFRFDDPAIFSDYIKPTDLAVMNEIDAACEFNFLHVCDYVDGYDDMSPFIDYPGDIVNCPLDVGAQVKTPGETADFFGRPYMGGLDRHGIIATGSQEAIKATVEGVLQAAPNRFFLAADCTLPGGVDWENLKTAIATAHAYR